MKSYRKKKNGKGVAPALQVITKAGEVVSVDRLLTLPFSERLRRRLADYDIRTDRLVQTRKTRA